MITKNRQSQHNAIEQFLQPELNGFRQKRRAEGKEVKNHMKQHRDNLKRTAEDNWKKKEEASQAPPKDLFKMKKFQNVTSRLRDDQIQQMERDDIRPQTAGY